MRNSDAQHVVRLSPRNSRSSEATTLAKRVPASAPTVLSRTHDRSVHAHTTLRTPALTDANKEVHHLRKSSHKHPAHHVARVGFTKKIHHTLSVSLGLIFASGAIGKFATILLIPMLLLQPLLPVYAADESVVPPESGAGVDAAPPAPSLPMDEVPVDMTTPEAPAGDTVVPEGDAPAPSEEIPENTESPENPEDGEDVVVVGEATTTPETAEDSGLPEETATTTDSTTSGEIVEETGGGATDETIKSEEATSTESEAIDNTSSDEISAEEVVTEEVPLIDEAAVRAAAEEVARVAEEARQEQIRQTIKKEVVSEFTKGCLTLDGVGYYCLKNFDGSAVGALTPSTAVTGVTSQKDPEGNYKQIFITRGGESIQLTHDTWDNTFPGMDVSGKSVVWQGMTEGRWQIFIADVSGTGTPSITQMTHGTESNFNPRVDGDAVVWQGWVNGNWEIFLADRLLPAAYYPLRPDTPQDPGGGLPAENRMLGIDNTWHVSRLTTNDTHDMFPSIAGGLATWQSSQGGSWNVYAYSVKSGVTTKLSQDGTKSENPRFAVTWDEHDANGNARMVGYDIASGKTIDITNEARNTPSGSAPYHPTETPISQPNQAALPPTNTSGTSTPVRADGDDAGGANPIAS